MNFEKLTIENLSNLYKRNEISFKEVITQQIQSIKKIDHKIFSLVNFDEEEYITLANNHNEKLQTKNLIKNIPVAVKDLIDIKNLKTEANSKYLTNNVAKKDAVIVQKLKSNGAFLGLKTNTHEFAYGAVTPPTKNPWDINKIPGGSSGGSAAAVASGISICALGTDTAGSIREPSALCSVVGLKPTTNLLSLEGIVPLAWSLDVVGPIAKTVTDCAILYSGLDSNFEIQENVLIKDEYKLGILSEYFESIDTDIKKLFEKSLQMLNEKFQCIESKSWNVQEIISTIFLILTAESAAFLSQPIKNFEDRFGGDVKQYVQMGESFSAVEYINAQRARNIITTHVDKLFENFDFLITPAHIIPPPSPDSDVVYIAGKEEPRDINLIKPLVLASLCGYPAISVPFIFQKDKPNFSIQIIAKRGDDFKLLNFGKLIESEFSLKYHYPTGV
jgi:aspartyl-tRNA(Asn)/glutamyl-tRNA(Gln) amidotransferase subunit A